MKAIEGTFHGRSGNTTGHDLPGQSGTEDTRYPNEAAILEAARHIGETILGPSAEATDQGSGPNQEAFQALGAAGLLGIGLPKKFGGLDASGATQREYAEILASYCGVTAFTQAQHHGSARMIANSPNEALKQRVAPELATGRMLCAVSFAHLRRPGPPVLRADPVTDARGVLCGWRLNGTAPWVTGWGLMNQVVAGATLPDGRFIHVWIPARREAFPELFVDCRPPDAHWGHLTASEPIRLAAMNASATVTLACDNLFIPAEFKLADSDRTTLDRNDRTGVLGATSLPLGCAAGSIRLLCSLAEKRRLPAIQKTAADFADGWNALKEEISEWNTRSGDPGFFDAAIQVRVRCLDFAARAALAAVAATSGGAIPVTNPAQRVLREAMFYLVQAQTAEVMEVTLSLLTRAGTTFASE